ncbi:hypothetical protein [Sinorhizobium psoraleae]|uniref:Uncharacterized protein n=1 Tax=Sinorhizobium psoraleae TaxID=520838 RepID=A0ABT4KBU5_9HYPH|nr:hypothetical protein [Sinorhizobium psoraleae]MCZ4089295.1 hypothetical protein [Sinorhizobium psoraleae]
MRISETITAANPVERVPPFSPQRAVHSEAAPGPVKLKRGECENINRGRYPYRRASAAMANAECRLIREDHIRKRETPSGTSGERQQRGPTVARLR